MTNIESGDAGDVSDGEMPVRSVARAIDVLVAVAGGTETLGKIASQTGLSKATVHRMLAALAYRAMIVQDPHGGSYTLGPGVIRLADAILRGAGRLGAVAQADIAELSEATHETVTLHVRLGNQRVCIAEAPSKQPVRFISGVGVAEPIHTGSAGKLLLAFLPEPMRAEIISGTELEPLTPNTITDPDLLADELAKIARLGYAMSQGERVVGAAGLSAPVFDREREVIGALSILGPSDRLDDETLEGYVPQLIACAHRVSERMSDLSTGDGVRRRARASGKRR